MSLENGTFTILHVSDVHATNGDLLYGSVNGIARLDQVGEYAVSAGITPEAVVVTGDLVQRGYGEAYPAVADALRRLESRLNAPVLSVLGNHDVPALAHCLPGHNARHYGVVHVGPLRIVLLDSSTGALDREQLDWLAQTVAEPYGMGTTIAVHHAPVPSPLPTLKKIGLANPAELADAIAGSDVRLMLAGHYHHPMNADFRGVTVSVGPSLAYHQVMDAGPSTVSGHDLAMFSLVQITADRVTTAPVSLGVHAPLFTTSVSSI
jgi:Icc protein